MFGFGPWLLVPPVWCLMDPSLTLWATSFSKRRAAITDQNGCKCSVFFLFLSCGAWHSIPLHLASPQDCNYYYDPVWTQLRKKARIRNSHCNQMTWHLPYMKIDMTSKHKYFKRSINPSSLFDCLNHQAARMINRVGTSPKSPNFE